MHHPVIHLVLAVYLAVWSPVLCCCAIKQTLGHMTGVAQPECELASGCCASPFALKKATPQKSCCAELKVDVEGDGPADSSAPARQCRCHEQSIDAAPGADAQVGSFAVMSMLVMLAPAAELWAVAWHTAPVALAQQNVAAHPPPTSLFALHCLLLM